MSLQPKRFPDVRVVRRTVEDAFACVLVDRETVRWPFVAVLFWRVVSVEALAGDFWRDFSGVMTITHWLPDQLLLAP